MLMAAVLPAGKTTASGIHLTLSKKHRTSYDEKMGRKEQYRSEQSGSNQSDKRKESALNEEDIYHKLWFDFNESRIFS